MQISQMTQIKVPKTWMHVYRYFPSSYQFISVALLCMTVIPWTVACQTSLSITNPQSLLKLMPIESVMPTNHFILCHPLFLLPSIFPSIRVFSSDSVLCNRWQKDWSFSISPSSDYSGLVSFRIDWVDLLAVQGTLRSLTLFASVYFLEWTLWEKC